MTEKGILHGIRVLDLSRMLSGPYCTMMLADHGAEVIKIEPATGDTSRGNGPYRDDDPDHDWAGYFVSLNRSKKSVVLDLKSEEGKAAFRELAATADVIVENFRPNVMERLGLGYETLAETNPALVYAAIRGFGDPRSGESPYAHWPSYDVVAQAMGGMMSITGPDAETPTKVGPGVGDIFAGLMMSFGVIAALRQAEATGKGQFVDVGMYDAMLSLCERAAYLHDFTGDVPQPEGNAHPFLAPFGLFPAADGAIALGIVDDTFWRKLADVIDANGLSVDPRFETRATRAKNATDLNAIVSAWTIGLTKAELGEQLGGLVPFGPLNTISDIFNDPHVTKREMLVEIPHPSTDQKPWKVVSNPLKFSGAATPIPQTPPRLGEDSDTYLAQMPPATMSDADKRALRNVFGAFATGVTVVTTRQENGDPRGFTANSFTSVSLDPPMLLICIAKSAHSCDTFMSASHFAVNILSEDQKPVSGLFASQDPDKFEKTAWHSGAADMPVLDETLAGIVCVREKMMDAGDHIVLLGRVIDHQSRSAKPLGYFQGNYFTVGLEDELVSAAARAGETKIGAVLGRGRQILLGVGKDGHLTIPKSNSTTQNLSNLRKHFERLGLKTQLDFLYAVYHDTKTGQHGVYYQGTVVGLAPPGHKFFNLTDIPLDDVPNQAERSLLVRYREEHQHGRFGIYQGDERSGIVHPVDGPKATEYST
jgi:crotonobetainyl-CoA:carnitine CoA-transferase CaiB-like acyl-CoA transferase